MNYILIFLILILLLSCESSEKEVQYYNNGKIKTEVLLKDGLQHGLGYKYYENGTIKSKINWVNGLKSGVAEYYYPNGQIKSRTEYKNDSVMIGETIIYSEDGYLQEKQIYNQEGNLIYFAEYGDQGKLRYETAVPIIKSKSDTIDSLELFEASIEFGIDLKGDVSVEVGSIEDNSFVKEQMIFKNNGVLKFSHKPKNEGKNVVYLKFNYEPNEVDSISVDQMIISHDYYVN